MSQSNLGEVNQSALDWITRMNAARSATRYGDHASRESLKREPTWSIGWAIRCGVADGQPTRGEQNQACPAFFNSFHGQGAFEREVANDNDWARSSATSEPQRWLKRSGSARTRPVTPPPLKPLPRTVVTSCLTPRGDLFLTGAET